MSKSKKVTAKAVKKVEENKEEKKMKNNQIEKIEGAAKAPIIPEDITKDEEMERIERENEEIFKKIRAELPADMRFAKIESIINEPLEDWTITVERISNDKCRARKISTGKLVFEGSTNTILTLLKLDKKVLEQEEKIFELESEIENLKELIKESKE